MPRYRSRVAAFVTFVIALSGNKLSTAAELEGKVHTVDTVERTVTLDNGTKVWVGEGIAIEDLREGAEVRVSYEERDGKNIATSVEKR
jgi:hypothetical protein